MKRRILLGVFAAFTALSLSACGSTTESTANDTSADSAQSSAQSQSESQGTDTSEADTSETATAEAEKVDEVQKIEVGQAVTIPDLCEFTVASASLKKEVAPPNPDGFYNYYAEEDGKTYVDVVINTKNLRTTARSADEFGTVTIYCSGGYEYGSFSTIEENGGSNFTYTNITNVDPLETGVIHYIAEIPNELTDDQSVGMIAKIKMLDNDYELTVR